MTTLFCREVPPKYCRALSSLAHRLTFTLCGTATNLTSHWSEVTRNFNLGHSLHSKHTYLICFPSPVQPEIRMNSYVLATNWGLLTNLNTKRAHMSMCALTASVLRSCSTVKENKTLTWSYKEKKQTQDGIVELTC